LVRERGGVTLVDEIYLGLSHDDAFGHSALGLPDGLGDEVISINSFSKYFNMTGWRLGWLVLPPALVPAVERLAQNLFICASTIAQHAALACFEPDSLAEYESPPRRVQGAARLVHSRTGPPGPGCAGDARRRLLRLGRRERPVRALEHTPAGEQPGGGRQLGAGV
jgi:aspartate/methionine/tyrosine aminotransferase